MLDSSAIQDTSLTQKLVLGELRKLTRGQLTLVFPDGHSEVIGQDHSVCASIRIRTEAFFRKCLLYGDIGFGEAYVDGDWDTDDVTQVIRWFIANIENNPAMSGSRRRFSPANLLRFLNRVSHMARANTQRMSKRNIAEHYDLSNEFFQAWLDPTMTYSSAIFDEESMTLEEAQAAKYERLCRLMDVRATDHVLEIGSGWGGFAVHAARTRGCRVTTITISKQQYEYARARFHREGLLDRIEIRLMDYRALRGQFDKIVSIEMLEAVGHRYLKTFFAKCHEVLKPTGAMGLQVIVCPDSRYDELRKGVDWIQKHIFPGSLLPSVAAMNRAINKTGEMTLYSAESFGHHYARTLALWRKRFHAARQTILNLGLDERFIRKWNYYFSYCEAAFATRNINVMQLVYARPNAQHQGS